MNAAVIIKGIHAPQVVARIKAIWLAELLEETDALPALATQYKRETAAEIKSAIKQAGTRLRHAVERNYSTIDAICEHYLIDRMIFEMPSRSDTQVMRQVQVEGETLGVDFGRGLLAGQNQRNTPVVERSDTNFLGRTMPTKPQDHDIKTLLATLRNDRDASQRVQALLHMGRSRNPRVLPDIAVAFKKDDAAEVRDTAERIGKRIYWNAVYLTMEHNGAMEKEIERRARAAGKLDEPNSPANIRRDNASADEIATMLNRVQKTKRRR